MRIPSNPNNGVINCSLGDDENYTCIFTCNTGYELTGSDTRTCQSDGSWNGSDVVCRKGECCYKHARAILTVLKKLYFNCYICTK